MNGSISQPSTPSLIAHPFRAIVSQCQIVIKMTGYCSLKKIHWCSFPCVRQVLLASQNKWDWSQTVIDLRLFIPLSYSRRPFLSPGQREIGYLCWINKITRSLVVINVNRSNPLVIRLNESAPAGSDLCCLTHCSKVVHIRLCWIEI